VEDRSAGKGDESKRGIEGAVPKDFKRRAYLPKKEKRIRLTGGEGEKEGGKRGWLKNINWS